MEQRIRTPSVERSKSRRRAGVPHAKRATVAGAAHVGLSIARGLPSLRTPRCYRVLERAFRQGKEKEGFQLFEFSVQRDHLHLIVRASDERHLARGMQGLAIRIAKALNKHWHRHGRVFADRYFARALWKAKEIWWALRYVINNGRKHGVWSSKTQPDPFSSGRWFQRWTRNDAIRRPLRAPPVAQGEYWVWPILPIDVDDVPGRRTYADSETETLVQAMARTA